MANGSLLNTRTTNFLELLGNGRIYRVPRYQRDYSWEEEQWEDLWNDILELKSRPKESHYMGALVVEGSNDRENQIIDGQQRLATLSLIALAVIARLEALARDGVDPDANRERASGLRRRFIGEKDPASLIESSKLFLNETDDGFYQDYLVQIREPTNPRGLAKSNRLLWECFGYFSRQLVEITKESKDGATLAQLLSETIARQLLFILITVDDELNAYTVFETLNARGLELSSTDLLKNYLFSRVRVATDLEALQRRWRSLIGSIGQERFPEFLRYHLLCEQPKVRSERLFKIVRERVRNPADVFSLMDALERRAELFSALSEPEHAFWMERAECKPFIRELVLFRTRQMTPLAFAAWEKLGRDDFARVLKLVSVISFRHTIVSGLNTNALEPAVHEAAKGILDGRIKMPSEVFAAMRSVYVDDVRFAQDFGRLVIDTSGQRKRLAKYILARLESDASSRSCDADTDPATIEHILPENPASRWEESFPKDQWDSAVNRLGNLTLLEAAANRRVANADFSSKRVEYEQSTYRLTARIAEDAPDEWNLPVLQARQERMAVRAVHLWRSDFA